MDAVGGFPGVTLVLDPLGRVIGQSAGSAPQIVYADLDPDELEGARSDANMYFVPLRQPKLYGNPVGPASQPSTVDQAKES